MRNLKYILTATLVACTLLLTQGCDSFLEPDPGSFSTTANFYETPTHFERAVTGAYSRLRTLIGEDEYRNMADLRGPSITRHFDVNLPHTVAGIPQLDEWTMTVDNRQSSATWTRTYALVKETNVILSRIEEIDFPDTALKNRLIGEAKFMRGLAYWAAVQFWGDVPLVLTEIRSPDEAIPEGGRTAKATVLAQVISDLTDAAANLPATHAGSDVGRATSGAARFVLGKAYLLTGDFSNALSQFQALDNGTYALEADFRNVFDPANKNNMESIFELQYDPNIAGQPDVPALIEDIIPWNSGVALSPANVVPRGVFLPTPDIIDAFEDGDLRRDASVDWWVEAGNNQYFEVARGDSLPILNKFYFPEHINANGQYNANWIVFRFADALLSAAEAAWRGGDDGAAMGYLDRVRARAGLPALDLGNFTGDATGSAMGDAILHERQVELLGEGHGWLDLLRFGPTVATSVMNKHGEAFRARDPKTADVYQIQDFKLLYPIPPSDVVLGELSQNPGW